MPERNRGSEIVRFHAGDLWIVCALQFRGRRRPLWLPNRWTPLFFHDEAVAFAAGHRPCGECRHASYTEFKAAWAEGLGVPPPGAGRSTGGSTASGPSAALAVLRAGYPVQVDESSGPSRR
jgi:hypothetical protein